MRNRAHMAVWSWSSLVGPYTSADVEPNEQIVCQPANEEATYGVATLPGSLGKVAFQSTFVEDSEGLWLYAGAPLGSLGTVLPVGAFPFGEPAVEPWEHILYAWLFGLAEHLHAEVPFERAIMGWLTTAEVDELAAKRLPTIRYHGYVVSNGGRLQYYPPNRQSTLLE